jgi:V8-like Glu-specific endopeptidase
MRQTGLFRSDLGLVEGFINFWIFACLTTIASALPTEFERDLQFKPIPLGKSEDTFTGTPPTYTFLSKEDVRKSFGHIDYIPAKFHAPSVDSRAIIGPDDRTVIDSTAFPYSAAGKVVWSDGSYCSGSLVSDHVVLTASHCVPWGQTTTISLKFIPDYFNGERSAFGHANVIAVNAYLQNPDSNFDSSACGINSDFAILRLDTGLSSKVGGTFGVQAWSSSLTSQPFNNVGYPMSLSNGEQMYQQKPIAASVNASFKCNDTGPIWTQADSSDGQSGGPLFTVSGSVITGVFSASNSQLSMFAAGSMVQLVAWAKANWN